MINEAVSAAKENGDAVKKLGKAAQQTAVFYASPRLWRP